MGTTPEKKIAAPIEEAKPVVIAPAPETAAPAAFSGTLAEAIAAGSPIVAGIIELSAPAEPAAAPRHRTPEQANRDQHLALTPQHRTAVDNNPAKVMVYVNGTSHLVPPGPLSVAEFKRITRTSGTILSLNGRDLEDGDMLPQLDGGETVFTRSL